VKLISPLFIPLSKDSDGSANVDLVSPKVHQGLRWRVELVSAEDESSAFTYLRVGVRRGGFVNWLEEDKDPRAGTLYWMPDPFWLDEGYEVIIRFNGTTSGDDLKATIVGSIAER